MSRNYWDGGTFTSLSSDDVNMFIKKLDERLKNVVGAGEHEAVTTLRDYILLLLRNGKVEQKLQDALADLIGEEEANNLTKWIGEQMMVVIERKRSEAAEDQPAGAGATVFNPAITTQREETTRLVRSVASIAPVVKRNVDVDLAVNTPNQSKDRMKGKGEDGSSSRRLHHQQQQPTNDRAAYHKVSSSVMYSTLNHGESAAPVLKLKQKSSSMQPPLSEESDNHKPPEAAQARQQHMKSPPPSISSAKSSKAVQVYQSTGKSNPARALPTIVGESIPGPSDVTATTPEQLYSNATVKQFVQQAVQQYQALMMQHMLSWSPMLQQFKQQYANGGLGPMVLTPLTWGRNSNFAVINHRFTRGRGRNFGRGTGRSIGGRKKDKFSHYSLRGSRLSTRGSVVWTPMGRGSGLKLKKASKPTGGRTQHLQWTKPPSLERGLLAKR